MLWGLPLGVGARVAIRGSGSGSGSGSGRVRGKGRSRDMGRGEVVASWVLFIMISRMMAGSNPSSILS